MTAGESGAQEVAISVKGGYTPDVIVVQKGRPVRLTFTPGKAGEYGFQRQMGILRGKRIVE